MKEDDSVSTIREQDVIAGTDRLPDLSADEFSDRYGCDRFTATVLTNRYRYVVSALCTKVRRLAFSHIIRDAADMCATLSGPESLGFPMAAVSETLPLFYGSIPDAVRIVIEEYGTANLRPGDLLLCNDYYRVGTHLNDLCAIRPVFHKGEFVAAVTLRFHQVDIGGMVFMGVVPEKENTFQDGLRLPPMLLYSEGQPVPSTFKLLYDNTRVPKIIMADLKTAHYTLEWAERQILDTIEKYGNEAFWGAMKYACDASSYSMSEALLSIPDGVYSGEEWLDGDGNPGSLPRAVRVKITKVRDRAEFDFRGSSPASMTAANCAWLDVKTGVAMALKFLIDPRYPTTSGTLQNVEVVMEPDTLVNPNPPHACSLYTDVVITIVYAIFNALSTVLGPDALTAGWLLSNDLALGYPEGRPERLMFPGVVTCCGPWGATKHGDGESAQQPIFMNLDTNGGVETYELKEPAVILRSEYSPDTGGAGANRGGASSMHDVMYLCSAKHGYQHFHSRTPSAGGGVYGGRAGALSAHWIWDSEYTENGRVPKFLPLAVHDSVYRDSSPRGGMISPTTHEADPIDGEYVGEFAHVSDNNWSSPGAIVRLLTTGGSGWGNPFTRDPQRVKADVRDEYVTIEGAARDYGVVVLGDPHSSPEDLVVDVEGTKRLRAKSMPES